MARITITVCDVCGKTIPKDQDQPFTVTGFRGGDETRYEFTVRDGGPASYENGACSMDCVISELTRWYAARQAEKAIEAEPDTVIGVTPEEKRVVLEGI